MVLMDVRLKGDMSGIESGKAIKASLHIPVIIMTAYTVDEIRTAYDLSDDFLFLTKPIQENLLTETVSIAWEQSNNDSPR